MHAAAEPTVFRPAGPHTFPPETVLALMGRPGNLLWVAVAEREVVGYAFAELRDEAENPWKYGVRVLELHQLGVRADHRGRGVGSQLLTSVTREADRLGVGQLTLSVWAFNGEARAFYRRHGLVTYQERMWLRPGGSGSGSES